jgi:hypothetical protein
MGPTEMGWTAKGPINLQPASTRRRIGHSIFMGRKDEGEAALILLARSLTSRTA